MRHPLVVGSRMNQKPTRLPPQFSQRCWFVGASPSTGRGEKRVSSSWMTVRPCFHLRGNLIIWPCWFQSMSAQGSQVLKFILSHLSAELQSGRWTSVSGPFTSCQHHTKSNNNDDVHGEPHPALTLLPWLEYFFTESARPWTRRRSTFSYSAVGEERKYDGHASQEAVVCTQIRKVLLIDFSLTICKKERYRRSSLPAAIRLCNRTQ